MAATASSAPNSSSNSPPYSLNTSMSRSRRVPSPRTQIVRGSDTHLIHNDSAASISPAVFAGDALLPPTDKDNAGEKPAWNKPSCGSAEVGPVMGAHSWPALSVSARLPSNKSSSSESLKGLSDGFSPSSIPSSLVHPVHPAPFFPTPVI